MTTQGNSPLVPGLAATADRLLPDRDDDALAFPARAATPDVPGAGDGTEDGVPVGEADAEADRRRSGADDTAV